MPDPANALLTTMRSFLLIFSAYLLLPLPTSSAPVDHLDNCSPNRVQQVPANQPHRFKVLVPHIMSYQQLANCSDLNNVRGFTIDVFERALQHADPGPNWTVHYDCFEFPNVNPPSYSDMIQNGTKGGYDAVVGDVTIAAARLVIADFSQPYIGSGITILTLAIDQGSLTFLMPFTAGMWCTILGAFLFTGLLLWILECKNHPEFQDGRLHQRALAGCGFVGSSLILMRRESIKSTTAHLLMVFWVIFGMLLASAYTAGLGSFLTAEKISPKVEDMNSILSSNKSIGYRRGSIVKTILINRFNIQEMRLVPLRTTDDFKQSLSNGSVMAVLDEIPYVDMFLSSLLASECRYKAIATKVTTEGFGFAFPHGSPLVSNISIGILNLSEVGCLRELQDKVQASHFECDPPSDSSQITVRSSTILYILLGVTLVICISIHYGMSLLQYNKKKRTTSHTHRTRSLQEPTMSIVYRSRASFHVHDVALSS